MGVGVVDDGARPQWPLFDTVIMSVIVCNAIVMGMPYFGSTLAYMDFVENANTTFAFVFTIEAILKITAQHSVYFQGARSA